MADNSAEVMAVSDPKVALDQHFARALSTKPSPPPCDCYIKPMEPFGEPAYGNQQFQRYYHSRNRVNILKRRTPVFPADSTPLKQKFFFPHPCASPSSQQYVVPASPFYHNVPNNVMVPPMTPMTPNSCMVAPGPPPPQPMQGWYPNTPEYHPQPPQALPHHRGGLVYPEFSQFLFHPEVDAFKDIPRVPGESVGDGEVNQSPVVMGPLTEQRGQTWANVPEREMFGNVSYVSPPSVQAAAVMDDLHLTDQELDGILELQDAMQ